MTRYSERELTADQVRRLPEGSHVTVHGTDRHGEAVRDERYVHVLPGGTVVLMSLQPFSEGFRAIRKSDRYTQDIRT